MPALSDLVLLVLQALCHSAVGGTAIDALQRSIRTRFCRQLGHLSREEQLPCILSVLGRTEPQHVTLFMPYSGVCPSARLHCCKSGKAAPLPCYMCSGFHRFAD